MDWAHSPFVIPVAVCAMVLGIVIVANIANYHTRKLKSEERMAAIARGVPLPPESQQDLAELVEIAKSAGSIPTGSQRARGLRSGGIVCIAVGIGLALFSFALAWILQEHDVLSIAAAGIIPLVIGIGLLVDYFVRNPSAPPNDN